MFSVTDSKRHIQEYEPERVTPVYTYITKKYLCEENVIVDGDYDLLDTLTFNIKENDPSMVWKSVRLCFPVAVSATNGQEFEKFRIADNMPSCNIAFAPSAYEVFSDMQLVVNGSVFTSQPNRFQGMLDRVYRGRDVLSFQSSGSLKPIVNRNLKTSTESNGYYEIQGAVGGQYVSVHDTYSSLSRNAFDLTQSNPGFITRAAQFQQSLQGSSYLSRSVLSMYMDIGIFQNKERKLPSGRRLYNDACPYLRDVMIRLTYDKLRSKFDSKFNAVSYADVFHSRDMPSKLLEFATPVNAAILGEPALPVGHWCQAFGVNFTEKPYIEVQFVQVPEQTLKPQYSLMALRHQHEISDVFNFQFARPTAEGFTKQSVTQRINSRLLEVPSKIYLWAGFSFNDKKSFFLGNTGNQRYCEISRLHLRMNTRSDALFEPTQLECFNIFKRLTLNDMNYQTWSKSPIYVFDPQALGQPEFLASDGKLMTYDWDCDVSPTSLIQSEMLFLWNKINRNAMGYDYQQLWLEQYQLAVEFGSTLRVRKYVNWIPNPNFYAPGGSPWAVANQWIPDTTSTVALTQRTVQMAYHLDRDNFPAVFHQNSTRLLVVNDPSDLPERWDSLTEGTYMRREPDQFGYRGDAGGVHQVVTEAECPEIWRVHRTLEQRIRFDNLIWALWDHNANQIYIPADENSVAFWYVPESWHFSMTPNDLSYTDQHGTFWKRRIFNTMESLVFAGDGTITLDGQGGHNEPIWAEDNTGQGIVRGKVSLTDTTGTLRFLDFNKTLAGAQASGYGPGPRGYPCAVTGAAGARVLSGIRDVGLADGGNLAANGQGNDLLRGGLPPENWIAQPANQGAGIALQANQTYFKMINPYTGGGADEHLSWIAFQPNHATLQRQNQIHRLVAWNFQGNPAANFVGVDAGQSQCGTISRRLNMAPLPGQANDDVVAAYVDIPKEIHVLKQVMERNVAETQLRAGAQVTDYRIKYDAQGNRDDRGAAMEITGIDVEDVTIANELEFSLNVLYEMGNDKYIVSKNGQMIQDNDTWTPTVQQKRARIASQAEIPERFTQDPRLKRAMPKLERVKAEPRASGFHSHY